MNTNVTLLFHTLGGWKGVSLIRIDQLILYSKKLRYVRSSIKFQSKHKVTVKGYGFPKKRIYQNNLMTRSSAVRFLKMCKGSHWHVRIFYIMVYLRLKAHHLPLINKTNLFSHHLLRTSLIAVFQNNIWFSRVVFLLRFVFYFEKKKKLLNRYSNPQVDYYK